jgi:hypothetical protein
MGTASLALYGAVGCDRYARPGEAGTRDIPAWFVSIVWQTYAWHFGAFTGATADPFFHRLTRPAPPGGRVRFHPSTPVLVVGTGPSLAESLPALRRVREHVCLVTSLHGAERLAREGLIPDLVLVEDRSALDAQRTLRQARASDLTATRLGPAWIALQPQTPPELARHLAGPRTFVLEEAPRWGIWPATAVAMAIGHDVEVVGLLGVDLGDENGVVPSCRPLAELLSLLAKLPGSSTDPADCGFGGAPKAGWTRRDLEFIAGHCTHRPVEVELRPQPSGHRFLDRECARLDGLQPVVSVARVWLDAACRIRDGVAGARDEAIVLEASTGCMAWANERALRDALTDVLGLTFLPRLWRHGLLSAPPHLMWRPLVLGLHELVAQADALQTRLEESRRIPAA